jgi:carboxymethylenebutenolidase
LVDIYSVSQNVPYSKQFTNASLAYLNRIPYYIEQAAYFSSDIKALVSYGGKKFTTLNETASESIPPQLIHVGGPHIPHRKSFSLTPDSQISRQLEGIVKTHQYDDAKKDTDWVLPADENYHKRSAGIAHTRSLTFLKKLLDGPWFDLEAIWEEHTKYEFGERDVEKTMATMVDDPYVNHIPTMTYVFPSNYTTHDASTM